MSEGNAYAWRVFVRDRNDKWLNLGIIVTNYEAEIASWPIIIRAHRSKAFDLVPVDPDHNDLRAPNMNLWKGLSA